MTETNDNSGSDKAGANRRLRMQLRGAVQGVGFRPFVYRLAHELALAGWVSNTGEGLHIEAEGAPNALKEFLTRLEREKPPRSHIQSLESSWLEAKGFAGFKIIQSTTDTKSAVVVPDIATCDECLRELFDPANRRYRYPFTNCTNCGPRYSIVESVPYDRSNTTMKRFALCPACLAEYSDPENRRFHAQPNACPDCGPHIELWDSTGRTLASREAALNSAVNAVQSGKILAIKGLGGFQLLVDARNPEGVMRLRERKRREEKPFALMFPSIGLAGECCEISEAEGRLLMSAESPIVLLRRKKQTLSVIASAVAPGNPNLGIMLPYTPLHHLLMAALDIPVVATSGNVSDEPICTDEREALVRLQGIADQWLVHNRPIARQVDDSVARIVLDRETILRRARGYAPLPIPLKKKLPAVLAVGAHLKNSVAMGIGDQAILSQHIGDLETVPAAEAFVETVGSLKRIYGFEPVRIACDLHPDYESTRFARQSGLPVTTVQHHYAHILSCMAENELEAPVLGVAWDGTGYGPDGTIWGGEFLNIKPNTFQRLATFRPFRLPGGDKAVKEPRRAALGVLFEAVGEKVFSMRDLPAVRAFEPGELEALRGMLVRGVNSPWTTSAGRLFDAVASLTGLRQRMTFEGQAAMELEFALVGYEKAGHYPLQICAAGVADSSENPGLEQGAGKPKASFFIDWEPMLWAILEDVRARVPAGAVSARFHNTLAEAIVTACQMIGQERVVLSGGCFQNQYLTARTVERLISAGFKPFWHQRVPANDGGIALGQLMASAQAGPQ
jgi:hydrogenase maturation protein HypF